MPSPWLIACTVLGGTLAAGGANAINMVVDRDIDRLMERTKNRPLVTGRDVAAGRPHLRHRPRGRRVPVPVGHGEPAERGAGRVGLPLLRVRVHALAEAHVEPQHRDRRRRRGRAHPHRLELGHRHPRLGAGGPLRHHLLLDPAPLLGPRHPLPGRLRRRRGADAAGGREPAPHRRCGSSATRCCCGPSPCCSRRWPGWATSTSGPRSSSAASSPGTPSGCSARPIPGSRWRAAGGAAEVEVRATAMRLFTWSITYITLLFGAMAVDQLVRSGW